MDYKYIILLILVMALVTSLLRFLPFIVFFKNKNVPRWVTYLGKVLPPAVMSMLLVYCLKDISFQEGNYGIYQLLCVALAMVLHAWKRNTILSIGVSTALYMVIVQLV
ncbi:MAG: branched-chain amino acid transporter permease [Bacilli bacterium]